MRDDDLAPARGICTAVLLSLAMVLLLALCAGCSPHLPSRPAVKESLTVPSNLDELDEVAERLLIAEAEQVDATAEMQAGPEVIW